MKTETPAQYLARIGSKGGRATGDRKRRSPEQIAALSRAGVEARARKARAAAAAEAEAELRAGLRAGTRQPRTFGDLKIAGGRGRYYSDGRCSFCKDWKPYVARYSVRHSVCEACAEARRDVLLPRVAKREAFEARMQSYQQLTRRQVRS